LTIGAGQRTARPAKPAAELTVARTTDELEEVRAAWQSIPWRRLDPDADYYVTVVRARPEVVRPHILLLPNVEGAETVFVARLEDVQLRTSVGYRVLHQPSVRALTLVHGGVAGADTFEKAARLIEELRATLARREADVVVLPALCTDSPLYEAASTRVPFLYRGHGADPTVHWALRLPATFDEYLRSRSKKTRENLRVYRNRLFRDHGDDIGVRIFRAPEEADALFRDVDTVAAKTYQRSLGVAFADTNEQRALTKLGLERGWFRVYMLYLRGEPIAFWPGSAYNGTFFVGTPGYDPAYGEYSIGTFLLMRVVEDLCSDAAIELLDFGFGEAEYKRRFGNERWEEADIVLYAPTVKAIRINLTRTALSGAARLAKRTLAHAGLAAALKRRWRRRLAGGGRS
jgi:CelD/BcsL family acetyltransferase involved in cellulose biosynthesis